MHIFSVDIGKRMGKHQSKDRQDSELESNKSKNVNAASVAGSTAVQVSEACPDLLPTAATGVESIPDLDIGNLFQNLSFLKKLKVYNEKVIIARGHNILTVQCARF